MVLTAKDGDLIPCNSLEPSALSKPNADGDAEEEEAVLKGLTPWLCVCVSVCVCGLGAVCGVSKAPKKSLSASFMDLELSMESMVRVPREGSGGHSVFSSVRLEAANESVRCRLLNLSLSRSPVLLVIWSRSNIRRRSY